MAKKIALNNLGKTVSQDIKAQSVLEYKAYAFDVFREVIIKTPVKTGRARGNWNITTMSPDFDTTADTSPNLTNDLDLNKFPTVWIANGLDYIVDLERGKSNQAPVGISLPALAAVRSRRR